MLLDDLLWLGCFCWGAVISTAAYKLFKIQSARGVAIAGAFGALIGFLLATSLWADRGPALRVLRISDGWQDFCVLLAKSPFLAATGFALAFGGAVRLVELAMKMVRDRRS